MPGKQERQEREDNATQKAVEAAKVVGSLARAAGIRDPNLVREAMKHTLSEVSRVWGGPPLESPKA